MADTETRRPPYVAWRTFLTFIEELRARGTAPQVIDNTVFGANRSGAARSELRVALRFFGLIDDENRPTTTFRALISSENLTETFRELVEDSYAPVLALGLDSATVRQVDSILMDMGAGTGATLRKARVFFVRAAEQGGLPLGPFLMSEATKGVSGPPRPRPKSRAPRRPPAVEAPAHQAGSGPADLHPLLVGLLQELPKNGAAWSVEERDHWIGVMRGAIELLYPASSRRQD